MQHFKKNVNNCRSARIRANRCSVPSEENLPYNNNNYNNNHVISNVIGKMGCATSLTSINNTPTHHQSSIASGKGKGKFPGSPAASPEHVMLYVFISGVNEKSRYPTTPPPHKKHQQVPVLAPTLMPELSLTKSRSHESQWSNNEISQMGK